MDMRIGFRMSIVFVLAAVWLLSSCGDMFETHPYDVNFKGKKDINEQNIKEIEKDKCINRMKGLLYGYYIGGLLSASLDDVVKLTTLREIHNVYAAILASVDHNATPFQYARLKELYSKIQPEIPLFSKLSKLVKEV